MIKSKPFICNNVELQRSIFVGKLFKNFLFFFDKFSGRLIYHFFKWGDFFMCWLTLSSFVKFLTNSIHTDGGNSLLYEPLLHLRFIRSVAYHPNHLEHSNGNCLLWQILISAIGSSATKIIFWSTVNWFGRGFMTDGPNELMTYIR